MFKAKTSFSLPSKGKKTQKHPKTLPKKNFCTTHDSLSKRLLLKKFDDFLVRTVYISRFGNLQSCPALRGSPRFAGDFVEAFGLSRLWVFVFFLILIFPRIWSNFLTFRVFFDFYQTFGGEVFLFLQGAAVCPRQDAATPAGVLHLPVSLLHGLGRTHSQRRCLAVVWRHLWSPVSSWARKEAASDRSGDVVTGQMIGCLVWEQTETHVTLRIIIITTNTTTSTAAATATTTSTSTRTRTRTTTTTIIITSYLSSSFFCPLRFFEKV